jgi:hypothetical protein
MVMKRMTAVLSALALIGGSSLLWAAADQSSAAQPVAPANQGNQGMNGNTPSSDAGAQNPYMSGSQTVEAPPTDWTQLTGMVQTVDQSAKTVEIKDDAGKLLQVPVDRQVKIEKDGKRVNLSQLQTGDIITLGRRNPTAQEQGSKTY